MSERGRFAPSPTGELHLGNARTALLSWLWSRQERAGYALRVEDIDRPRIRPGMAEQQLDELRWLGLDWDGPPVFQSARTACHEDALRRLPATARQILLHRLLGQREPRWAHAPLVIAANGERLSKRDQSLSLSALRARGADPRQVVAHLARLSGMEAGDGASPRDLIKLFSLSKV